MITVHDWRFFARPSTRSTYVEAFRPGSRVRDYLPSRLRDYEAPVTCIRQGQVADLDDPVGEGDHLHFQVRPNDPNTLVAVLISTLVSTAVSFLYSLLFPLEGPKKRGDEKSKHHGFSGVRADRVEGQPREVHIGETRTAGTVIEEWTVTESALSETVYNAVVAFGEGPLTAIGDRTSDNPPETPLSSSDPANPLPTGVELNGNPVGNLADVEMHVRMGTNEQLPIPGIPGAIDQTDVGIDLDADETAAASNAATVFDDVGLVVENAYNTTNATVQAWWDSYRVRLTLDDAEYDSASIVTLLRSGLYRLGSNGNLLDAHLRILFRYRLLDSFGDPITTGGDNGDGWVYGVPPEALTLAENTAVRKEYPVTFFDPAQWTPPVQGNAFRSPGGVSDYAQIPGGVLSGFPTSPGAVMTSFSVEFWVTQATPPASPGISTHIAPLFSWTGAGNGQGFVVGLCNANPVTLSVDKAVPCVLVRRVLHTDLYIEPVSFSTPVFAAPEHWVVTYDGATVKIYRNGALALSTFVSFASSFLVPSSSPLFRFCQRGHMPASVAGTVPANFFQVTVDADPNGVTVLDEARMYSRALSAGEVSDHYQLGRGTYGDTGEAGLVAGYHFDAGAGTDDYSPNGNDLALSGSATAGTEPGRVYVPGSGPRLRGKYELDVVRINKRSSSTLVGDDAVLETIKAVVEETFAHPNTPQARLSVRASGQVNTSAPDSTFVVRGIPLQQYDPDGGGFFKAYSKNPAWAMLEIATNPRWGGGNVWPLQNVRGAEFHALAAECDFRVYDGLHQLTSAGDWFRIRFEEMDGDATFGGRGRLTIEVEGETRPPHWKAGHWIQFRGVDVPASGDDPNAPPLGGYEIQSVVDGTPSGGFTLVCFYDRLDEGLPWAENTLLGQDLGNPTPFNNAGTIRGAEARFELDIVLDTFVDLWQRLLQIGETCRARPVRDGTMLGVRFAGVRSAEDLVTYGTIVDDEIEVRMPDLFGRPNRIEIDFLDRDRNWTRSMEPQEAGSLTSASVDEEVVIESLALEGVTRRSQCARHAKFLLKANELIDLEGRVKLSPDSVPYEAGTVLELSHPIVPRGTSGRVVSAANASTVTIDQDYEVAAGTTYLRIRNSATNRVEAAAISLAPGSYPASTAITLSTPLSFVPAENDPYTVIEDGKELLIEVAAISLEQRFQRVADFTKHDNRVYEEADETPQLDSNAPVTTVSQVSEQTIPGAPDDLVAVEQVVRGRDGTMVSEIALSWVLEDSTKIHVEKVVVYASTGRQRWRQIGVADGPAGSITVPAPPIEYGETFFLAVQPVSYAGAKARPQLCANVSLALFGLGRPPAPPANVAARMVQDKAVYEWTLPEEGRDLVVECRRTTPGCGWIAAPVVFVSAPGASSFGPTRDWAGASKETPDLMFRTRNARGQYSEPVRLSFAPSPEPTPEIARTSFPDKAWEDHGTGWDDAGDATLVGLVVDADGRLHFDGASLTGTWTSPPPALRGRAPEETYLEAVLATRHEHPRTWNELGAWVDLDRWSWEGPTLVLPGESENATAEIQFRVNGRGSSGAWGPWEAFRPGRILTTEVQWRIVLTRPSTDYDLFVEGFRTRARYRAQTDYEATELQRTLERRRRA